MENREKTKWFSLLMIAILLFIVALLTQLYVLNLIVIVLAVYIYKYGNPVLFKEYDAKRKVQYQQYQTVQKAAQESLRQGSIFKK
ncbi:hypothetical protein ACWOFR_00655 [Carnobacterium gallinarum]|uniref:hypothetical protein n=1 Tax=Carnobacterium gallinarum TaxID=2749 RepID=UPI0005577136|nr:hypothetical protein [Carnobacterium gallinarum]